MCDMGVEDALPRVLLNVMVELLVLEEVVDMCVAVWGKMPSLMVQLLRGSLVSVLQQSLMKHISVWGMIFSVLVQLQQSPLVLE